VAWPSPVVELTVGAELLLLLSSDFEELEELEELDELDDDVVGVTVLVTVRSDRVSA
jgi:hypothetical protein